MRIELSLEERGLQVVGRFHCPARRASATIDFIMDTGSSCSFLSWEDALAAKVEAEELTTHPRPVAGFEGTAQARAIPETCYVYLKSTDASLEQVEMKDGFLVYK